ncbi:type VI secretion system baseplate subunit TssG [bacterium]|nr:type VI secretion system baseplate subunit TssG [bacterium]MBU1754244.1 type VI secretion system baseplate subunit TssG [bacterium]
MATSSGQAEHHVKDRLLNQGYKFDFFQATLLLEKLEDISTGVNETGQLSAKQIRFQPDISLGFPSSAIKRIEMDSEMYRIIVTFMGLYGTVAPTPVYFTELVSSSSSSDIKRSSLKDFLDIFNHRLISLYYRAWKKYRYYLTFQSNGNDPISEHLLSLFGMDMDVSIQAAGLPIVQLIKYAGILSMRVRSTSGLRTLVSDFFGGITVRIDEFLPQWVSISEDYQNKLGMKNSRLGIDFSLGNQVLDRSGRFRVIIGPISLARYESFLPDTEQFKTLQWLITMYVSYRLEFEVKFIIKGEEIPQLEISSQGTSRLGYTTWVLSSMADKDKEVRL